MGTIFLIILGIAAVIGIGSFIFSHEADPKERAKEAAGAAAGGAMASMGCLLQAVLSAIPVLIGLFIIGLMLRSCS
jgi:hypothetical protein